jgi:hypothetical protein
MEALLELCRVVRASVQLRCRRCGDERACARLCRDSNQELISTDDAARRVNQIDLAAAIGLVKGSLDLQRALVPAA